MDRHQLLEALPAQNIGAAERALTAAAGGVILAAALRRGSVLAGVAGGLLVARGLSGYCPAYGLWSRYRGNEADAIEMDRDDVNLAAEDSFPASDPPSFNPGRA